MFNLFKKEEPKVDLVRFQALEDYLDIKYCTGNKRKPHYRKRRVIKRPVGRPHNN